MDKCKVLVVDDESRMRKLVSDFLTKQGYEVLEAGDGEAALDIFYNPTDYSGCDDAEAGWLGRMQRNPKGLKNTYYYADCQRR